MARKQSRLCWDDVADIWSGNLAGWGAFKPDLCETIELAGEGIEEGELATFIMDSDGKAFTLIYVWHGDDDDAVTVKKRVRLAEIPRGFGHEIVFRCPVCERRCKRLALQRYGLGCAKCLGIVWGSNREGKCARLVRRATYIAQDLGLQSWAEQPVKKPSTCA